MNGNNALSNLITVFTMIIGVAILGVIVSKNASTANVLSSLFGGFSQVVGAAVSPVTGTNSVYNTLSTLPNDVANGIVANTGFNFGSLTSIVSSFDTNTNSGLNSASGSNDNGGSTDNSGSGNFTSYSI